MSYPYRGGPSTLAAFMAILNDEIIWYRALNFIDLFLVWWIEVLSIGLSVLYRRCARITADILIAVYFLMAIGFAASGWGGSS